jgi:hypothetical protein
LDHVIGGVEGVYTQHKYELKKPMRWKSWQCLSSVINPHIIVPLYARVRPMTKGQWAAFYRGW